MLLGRERDGKPRLERTRHSYEHRRSSRDGHSEQLQPAGRHDEPYRCREHSGVDQSRRLYRQRERKQRCGENRPSLGHAHRECAPQKTVYTHSKAVRIYGIHFDVDSAVIQARSEPVIAEIAQIMRENPSWRFQIEGHADSDDGAAYNLAPSQRRAQAVVDDLVKRYGIARSRMIAKGYGLTKSIASNTTDEGTAFNRRVELVRL